MRRDGRLVQIHFVEVVDVLVRVVLQHIEADAAGLVPLGAERVHLDRFEEAFAQRRQIRIKAMSRFSHPDAEPREAVEVPEVDRLGGDAPSRAGVVVVP